MNQIISQYLKYRPFFFSFIRPQEGHFFRQSIKNIKSPVLDFGCGDGFFAQTIFDRSHYIDTGLDIKESRINEAKDKTVYRKLVTYDGKKIPFSDNHFNTIISNCVFEHLPDLTGNIQEMYRVLKPGGHLLTTVMTNKWEDYMIGKRLLGNWYLKIMRQQQEHLNLLSAKEWQTIHQQAGFKFIQQKGYLSPSTAKNLELAHYIAVPQLISYKLFHKWTMFPQLHQLVNSADYIHRIIAKDIITPPQKAAALFLILQKPPISLGK